LSSWLVPPTAHQRALVEMTGGDRFGARRTMRLGGSLLSGLAKVHLLLLNVSYRIFWANGCGRCSETRRLR